MTEQEKAVHKLSPRTVRSILEVLCDLRQRYSAGADVAFDIAWEGSQEDGQALRILVDLISDVAVVLVKIAEEQAGREMLVKAVRDVEFRVGPEFGVRLEDKSLVVVAPSSRGKRNGSLVSDLRSAVEKVL